MYDSVAEQYDAFYDDAECTQENKLIKDFLEQPLQGCSTAFDIGCGTGLLLDISAITEPAKYIGIDPSAKMLEKFAEKHPAFKDRLVKCKMEEYDLTGIYDAVLVSLFGSPSYIHQEALIELAEYAKTNNATYFLMFYKKGYYSRILTGVIDTKHNNPEQVFPDLIEWKNYLIATNIPEWQG